MSDDEQQEQNIEQAAANAAPQPDQINVATEQTYGYNALCTPLWDEIPGAPSVVAPWDLHFHRSVRGAGVIAQLLAKSAQLREENATFTNPEGRPLAAQMEEELHLVLLQLLHTIGRYADGLWGEALQASRAAPDARGDGAG